MPLFNPVTGGGGGLPQDGDGTFTETADQGNAPFGYAKDSGVIAATTFGGTAHGYATGVGSALTASGNGATAFGYAASGGEILSPSEGSVAFGKAANGGTITSGVANWGRGTLAGGYAYDGSITASATPGGEPGAGALAFGYAYYNGAQITASAWGTFAGGYSNDGGSIVSSKPGGFVWGGVSAGTLSASGIGGSVFGHAAAGGVITASFLGSHARGRAFVSGAILASGVGSTAHGYATGAGSALTASGIGSTAFGYTKSAGVITSFGSGTLAGGYASGGGQIRSSYKGSFAFGYADESLGTGIWAKGQVASIALGMSDYGGNITAGGNGSLAGGYSYYYADITTEAFGPGSIAWGYSNDGGVIKTSGNGGVAFGSAVGGTLHADGAGSMVHGFVGSSATITSASGSTAFGYATGAGSALTASSNGSTVFGYATGGYAITASAVGALAFGGASAASIVASAAGAAQFGPGTNAVANSLQVGSLVNIDADDSSIVLDKTSGAGFKVDLATPDYPWKDLIGLLSVDEAGANAATLTAYRGGSIREYLFGSGDLIDIRFHMPHDYAPGTDLFIHVHWSHNGTAITGTGTTTVEITHSYAKGFDQASFTAEEVVTVTNANVTTATVPQYRHMTDEVQLSGAGGTGGLLDTALLEVDGMLLVQAEVTSIPTVTGGSAGVFIHAIDIHYQSTNIGTAGKAPDFYA